jgi:hypothetical protein
MTQQKKIGSIAGLNSAVKHPLSAGFNAPMVSRLPDTDMQAAPAALARAAQSARELAALTGTPLIVVRDGKLVEVVIQHDMAKPGHGIAHDQ